MLFGEIVDDEMRLNNLGRIVEEEWFRSAEIRTELVINGFVVMPNHIHDIVQIDPDAIDVTIEDGAHRHAPLQRVPGSLGAFIAGYKRATTKRVNALRGTPGDRLWQRNYYEHIIRSEDAMDKIRNYITTNPQRWHLDQENPDRHR